MDQVNLYKKNNLNFVFRYFIIMWSSFSGRAIYTVYVHLSPFVCKSYKVILSGRFRSDVLDSTLNHHHENTN